MLNIRKTLLLGSSFALILLSIFAKQAYAEAGYRVCVSNDSNYFVKIKKGKKCPTSDGYKSKVYTCEDFTRTFTRWGEWNICPGVPFTSTKHQGHGSFNPTRNGAKHPKRLNLDVELNEFSIEWVTKKHFVYGPLCEKNGKCPVSFNIGNSSATKAGVKFKNKYIPWVEVDASHSRSFKSGISVGCNPNEGYEAKLELVNRNSKYSFKDFEKRGGTKCHFELSGQYEKADKAAKACASKYRFWTPAFSTCISPHLKYLL